MFNTTSPAVTTTLDDAAPETLNERIIFVSEVNEKTANWLQRINCRKDPELKALAEKDLVGLEEWRPGHMLWQIARLVYEVMELAVEHGIDIEFGTDSLRRALDGTLYKHQDH